MQDRTPGPGKLTKLSNGHVVRLHRCDCGTPIYKKDLTDNTYAIQSKDRAQNRDTLIEAEGVIRIKCSNPACDLWHIIASVRENISIVEKFDVEPEEGVQ
jgi:hypothetical protein